MGVTLITLRLLEPRGNQVMDKVLAHLCLHTAHQWEWCSATRQRAQGCTIEIRMYNISNQHESS